MHRGPWTSETSTRTGSGSGGWAPSWTSASSSSRCVSLKPQTTSSIDNRSLNTVCTLYLYEYYFCFFLLLPSCCGAVVMCRHTDCCTWSTSLPISTRTLTYKCIRLVHYTLKHPANCNKRRHIPSFVRSLFIMSISSADADTMNILVLVMIMTGDTLTTSTATLRVRRKPLHRIYHVMCKLAASTGTANSSSSSTAAVPYHTPY